MQMRWSLNGQIEDKVKARELDNKDKSFLVVVDVVRWFAMRPWGDKNTVHCYCASHLSRPSQRRCADTGHEKAAKYLYLLLICMFLHKHTNTKKSPPRYDFAKSIVALV